MGQALYRKYRSRGFAEVVGQDYIVKTLQNAIKNGRISHAYLFSGPKGVGKTSIARILAYEVNNLPYQEDSIHLDIIEIDAASNRRIDEIRELRERVHIAPTSAKYKVYIIDEVHMLTREAFNALLKTLEEPPNHCIFILATTEAHKLPETIISRTQHFNFKPIDQKTAAGHLKMIAKKEKIDIEPAALELLAEHGGGSFRDSISLLDQLSAVDEKISLQTTRDFLGLPPAQAIDDLMMHMSAGDSKNCLATLDKLKVSGADPLMVAKALNDRIRQMLLDSKAPDWSVALLRRLSEIGATNNPQSSLEIDILSIANQNQPTAKTAPTAPEPTVKVEHEAPQRQPKNVATSDSLNKLVTLGEFDLENWEAVINRTRSEAPSLYTALRLAEPRLENQNLILAFQFPLHQKKVAQAKNIDTLGKIIEDLTGSKLKIQCIVDKKLNLQPEKPIKNELDEGPSLETISNIFGSAEVIES